MIWCIWIGFLLMAISIWLINSSERPEVANLGLAGFAAGMLILVFGTFGTAMAHDHERPELNTWFQTLSSGKGLCCDGNDALHLHELEWETQNKEHSHYRVKIPKDGISFDAALRGAEVETLWADVDDDAVVDEPNKAGEALVWPMYGYLGATIRCFMPGSMT